MTVDVARLDTNASGFEHQDHVLAHSMSVAGAAFGATLLVLGIGLSVVFELSHKSLLFFECGIFSAVGLLILVVKRKGDAVRSRSRYTFDDNAGEASNL